jgi:signal transduction histidine kinase/CheY-like chemotaxis protein
MIDFLRHILTDNYMPHGMCFLWQPGVLWLNVASDGLIAASYYAIPFLLFRFARKRRDISFNWIFVAFGLFIIACGTSHLMAAITVWDPVYRLEGTVKAITALASVATFLGLIPMMPTLVELPSPAELAGVNKKLAREIEERRVAEESVRRANEELESRVASRTASLERALTDLQSEMERRTDLEGQLIQAQKMEAVGRLAGGVAHDFNNLLTVILGNNEMLLDGANDEAIREFGEEIRRAAGRAADLTNQLLAFSRRQVAVPRLVYLNEVVRNVEKMLRRIIGEDIELSMTLAESLPAVQVDPAHIDQVIMNLAVNSRDAMPKGGRLGIQTSAIDLSHDDAEGYLSLKPGRYVQLSVSDTGSGMDAATRARIFEPFFTTKEQGKGTGLGLSIVYGIVKQNGGEILVYSEPGHGTEFKVYLPAAGEAADCAAAVFQPARVPPAATETVLLVEDEDQVRHLIRAMLIRQGYTVLDASSPVAALDSVRENADPIHLLLTDIVMPHMNGVDLAAGIQKLRPNIKVVFMSGYSDSAVVNRGILSPETAFLQKPFSMETLQTKLREVLEKT